ncbi:hypothetical protein ACFX2A_004490 [Malus domestica]
MIPGLSSTTTTRASLQILYPLIQGLAEVLPEVSLEYLLRLSLAKMTLMTLLYLSLSFPAERVQAVTKALQLSGNEHNIITPLSRKFNRNSFELAHMLHCRSAFFPLQIHQLLQQLHLIVRCRFQLIHVSPSSH